MQSFLSSFKYVSLIFSITLILKKVDLLKLHEKGTGLFMIISSRLTRFIFRLREQINVKRLF